MKVIEEEFGGTLVIVEGPEDMGSIPGTHRHLVTPEIKAWCRDPYKAVQHIAERAASPRMSAWFSAMSNADQCHLELHMAQHVPVTRAGFWYSTKGIRGAEIGPPPRRQATKHLPLELAFYYKLVGYVHWMDFGAAGGLEGNEQHVPLSTFKFDFHGASVDLTRSFVFGASPCGDMMIYTADGWGGWLCHENGKIHLLGSIADTIDWVFGELLANRCPEFDYNWV